MQMGFKEWLKLQEVGTGTNAIAVFSRQIMPMVTRIWPTWGEPLISDDHDKDDEKPKKKKKKDKKKD